MPVTSETAAVKPRTGPFSWAWSVKPSCPLPRSSVSRRMPQKARPTPTAPPNQGQHDAFDQQLPNHLSLSGTQAQPNAISRRRAAARDIWRLAMLAQAIARTSITIAKRT